MEAQNRNYHSKKYTARARHFFPDLKITMGFVTNWYRVYEYLRFKS